MTTWFKIKANANTQYSVQWEAKLNKTNKRRKHFQKESKPKPVLIFINIIKMIGSRDKALIQ